MTISEAARSSGVYGLFRLDGGPIDPRDIAALGWTPGDDAAFETGAAARVPSAPGHAFALGHDTHAPDAVHRVHDTGGLTVLAGYLDEAEALAGRLGVSSAMPHALLARAALARFGADVSAEMIGEWSLLHWDDAARRLVLTLSAGRRDPVLFAVERNAGGTRVAVAPDLPALSRIDWIGREPDPAGLLFAVGRAQLRAHNGDHTMLAKVRELAPATSLTITADGRIHSACATIFAPQPRFTGSFDDAIDEVGTLLRRIMRQRVRRTKTPGATLSGGLDSSILSWVAARERGAGQPLVLLTSAAPPGSGLDDETGYADMVAAHLGLTNIHVSPPLDVNTYRPTEAILRGGNGPPLSTHHALYDALQAHGKAAGATMLIDGNYGEMSVTGRFPLTTMRARLRGMASRLRRSLIVKSGEEAAPTPFHVRLSAARNAMLPDAIRTALAAPAPAHRRNIRRPGDPWGYLPGIDKGLANPGELYPGALRIDMPYCDLRLLRLFASFPADFLRHDGLDRAPARHLLAGQLPDAIRLRTVGKPYSPEHMVRLQRQAPLARARIAAFRAADVGEWLDLDWLADALARVAEHGPMHVTDANEVQLTAIIAEYLTWWHHGGR